MIVHGCELKIVHSVKDIDVQDIILQEYMELLDQVSRMHDFLFHFLYDFSSDLSAMNRLHSRIGMDFGHSNFVTFLEPDTSWKRFSKANEDAFEATAKIRRVLDHLLSEETSHWPNSLLDDICSAGEWQQRRIPVYPHSAPQEISLCMPEALTLSRRFRLFSSLPTMQAGICKDILDNFFSMQYNLSFAQYQFASELRSKKSGLPHPQNLRLNPGGPVPPDQKAPPQKNLQPRRRYAA